MRYLIVIDDPQQSLNPGYIQSGLFAKELRHRLPDAVFIKVVSLPDPDPLDQNADVPESVLDT